MTRKEEIKEARHEWYLRTQDADFCAGFQKGAEWADAHPVVKVGGALKNYERGYEDAIDKACEWLDENMNDVGIRFMRGDEIKDIVDLFYKAMKGE